MHGGGGRAGVGPHSHTNTPGQAHGGAPSWHPQSCRPCVEKEKTRGSGPTASGPHPPKTVQDCKRGGRRRSPGGRGARDVKTPPTAGVGLRRSPFWAPSAVQTLRRRGRGRRARAPEAPHSWPGAPGRLPGGARVPRRAPQAGSAAPSLQLGQHFALTLAPAPGKLRDSAGAGAGGGGPGLRGGGAHKPPPPRPNGREGGLARGKKGGRELRRRARGRSNSSGCPASCAGSPGRPRWPAHGPQVPGAPRSPAQSRARPPRRHHRPREPPAGRDYISSGARLDLAGPRQSCASARC